MKLMVMMEVEVTQAILNLPHVPFMLATHMVHMMVIVIAQLVLEQQGGILRGGGLICNQAIDLNTLLSLRR
jgi:hypothetical protein